MEKNEIGHDKPISLIGPTAILGASGAVGLWLWLAQGVSLQVLLAPAVLLLAAALIIVWQSRARAARRLRAVVDAYADREIARSRSKNTTKRPMTFSTRRRMAGTPR